MPIYKLAATSQDGNVEYYLEGKEQADWGKFCESCLDSVVRNHIKTYPEMPIDGAGLIDELVYVLVREHDYELIIAQKENTFKLSNWLYGTFDDDDRPDCIPEPVYQKIIEQNKKVMSDEHDTEF